MRVSQGTQQFQFSSIIHPSFPLSFILGFFFSPPVCSNVLLPFSVLSLCTYSHFSFLYHHDLIHCPSSTVHPPSLSLFSFLLCCRSAATSQEFSLPHTQWLSHESEVQGSFNSQCNFTPNLLLFTETWNFPWNILIVFTRVHLSQGLVCCLKAFQWRVCLI